MQGRAALAAAGTALAALVIITHNILNMSAGTTQSQPVYANSAILAVCLQHILSLMKLVYLRREENALFEIFAGHEFPDGVTATLLFSLYERELFFKLRNLLRQWVQEEVLHKLRGR